MYLIQHSHVKGGDNIGKFKDCFKVTTVDYDAGRATHQAPIGSSHRTIGSLKCSPIRISKFACKASRALQESCHFGEVSDCKIIFVDSTNTEYLEISLKDSLFTNYKFQAHGGRMPRESFDITFTAISTRHVSRDIKGAVTGSSSTSFNLTKNAKE